MRMSKKSKVFFIASCVTWFLPLLAMIPYTIESFSLSNIFMGFWMFASVLPGILLYLIVPFYKRHFYKTKEDPTQRKYGLITTCVECGVPVLVEIVCFIFLRDNFATETNLLIARIIYAVSYIPFFTLNILFWLSLPKEEKKEV